MLTKRSLLILTILSAFAVLGLACDESPTDPLDGPTAAFSADAVQLASGIFVNITNLSIGSQGGLQELDCLWQIEGRQNEPRCDPVDPRYSFTELSLVNVGDSASRFIVLTVSEGNKTSEATSTVVMTLKAGGKVGIVFHLPLRAPTIRELFDGLVTPGGQR